MSHATASSKTTTDHNEIQKWIEARGRKPAVMKETEDNKEGGAGLLQEMFQDDENSEEVLWDDFLKHLMIGSWNFFIKRKLRRGKKVDFLSLSATLKI